MVLSWEDSQVIQQLRGRGPSLLKIPRFVKLSMMTRLDQSRIQIQINNVLIRRGVSEKNALKVMAIQFAASRTSLLDAYPRPKKL